MIKRIIFDLDNTLIEWKKEYDNVINNALEAIKYPFTQQLCDEINKGLDKYENDIMYYNKQEMLNCINKYVNKNLPIQFIEEWLKNVEQCVPDKMEDSVISTLEYLKSKYELVILTNWFGKSQKARLENADIAKYFEKIYDGEKYTKPHKEAFLQAIGELKPEECAMVGDSLILDIKSAQKVGIGKAIWKDNHNKKDEYSKELNGIDVINQISELKNLL